MLLERTTGGTKLSHAPVPPALRRERVAEVPYPGHTSKQFLQFLT